MKTLIVGTGVIGTTYGWALAESGADVTHLVRPDYHPIEDPVRIDVLDERTGHPADLVTTYRRRTVSDVRRGDRYDLVIVPVNTFQLSDALASLAEDTDAPFLVMSLLWDGPGVIDRYLPRNRYLLAYPDAGGTVRDGVYWTNLGGELHIGRLEGQERRLLERVRGLFNAADIELDVQANILHWLWIHNAMVVGFAAAFPKHGDYSRMLRDRPLLETCFKASKELLALCEARDVDIQQFPDVGYMTWPNWLLMIVMRVMYARNKSMQRFTAHAGGPSSQRESAEAYRAVLRMADELRVPMPGLRSLEPFVAAVERPALVASGA
jgi:2-dehydropantoate 2-reductase